MGPCPQSKLWRGFSGKKLTITDPINPRFSAPPQTRKNLKLIRAPQALLVLLFFGLSASATSFGPLSPAKQAAEAPYVLYGRILTPPAVEIEPESQRPHTYWRFSVIEQWRGPPVAAEIQLRSPGGEVNGIGYHVASPARFAAGEEVVVMVQDAAESELVKAVFGLASGKYTVEQGPGGSRSIRHGFGLRLTWPEGQPLSVEEFRDLVLHAGQNQNTERERRIILAPPESDLNHSPAPPRPTETKASANSTAIANSPAAHPSESPQATPGETDTSLRGHADRPWILLGLAGGIFLAGAIWLWRRKR